MEIKRRQTRQIKVGGVAIGGGAPIVVQSMTTSKTTDIPAAVAEILRLEDAGCEVIRVAVPDDAAAKAISKIKKEIHIPLIADIHFSHKLAIESMKSGADGIRINPGNIGGEARVREVVAAAKDHGVSIRVGVNSGSLEKDLLEKYGWPSPEAMVESAMRHIRFIEGLGFHEMKVAVKQSSVRETVEAYRLLSKKCDYPLHVGVTEAGTPMVGATKSALGIGILLSEGIGDTIRVSLTGDSVNEIKVAYEILASLGLRKRPGVEIVSCPTCGRLQIDLLGLVERVEKRLANIKKPLKVSILGCVVNGPGEAREADIGIAGGGGKGMIIKKGKLLRTCPEADLEDELMREIEKM